MKKFYIAPKAHKVTFNYAETVVASTYTDEIPYVGNQKAFTDECSGTIFAHDIPKTRGGWDVVGC